MTHIHLERTPFCETCKLEEQVRTTMTLLRAHGYYKAANYLALLLEGKLDEDI